MQIATTLANEKSFQDAAKRVVELERAGLDFVWVAENSGFDSPSHMGYLAARTERVRIGSGIMPIYTRTPTLIAMTAAGIDSLSGGRFELGLGAGGVRIIEGFHGVSFDSSVGRTARDRGHLPPGVGTRISAHTRGPALPPSSTIRSGRRFG